MSLEAGAVTARMFFLSAPLPDNAVELFAKKGCPGLEALNMPGCTSFSGWVAGRHLLDRVINAETAMYSGYLRLTYMTAEKRVNESLLKNECKLEFLAREKSKGAALHRKERSDIQSEVKQRLLGDAQPSLRGMSFVYKPGSLFLFAEAMTDRQQDVFVAAMRDATGAVLYACNAGAIAAVKSKIDVRTIDPAVFYGDETVSCQNIGVDFMTWLWFQIDTGHYIDTDTNITVMLDSPIRLVSEGSGAHECILRKGTPMNSIEAKSALLSGKKLYEATVIAARGKEAWKCTFNAATWTVSALSLPFSDGATEIERFQGRMISLESFHNSMVTWFMRFLASRTSAEWSLEVFKIADWISTRCAR